MPDFVRGLLNSKKNHSHYELFQIGLAAQKRSRKGVEGWHTCGAAKRLGKSATRSRLIMPCCLFVTQVCQNVTLLHAKPGVSQHCSRSGA